VSFFEIGRFHWVRSNENLFEMQTTEMRIGLSPASSCLQNVLPHADSATKETASYLQLATVAETLQRKSEIPEETNR